MDFMAVSRDMEGFLKWGYPNRWFMMDDLGVPWGTPILGNHQMFNLHLGDEILRGLDASDVAGSEVLCMSCN